MGGEGHMLDMIRRLEEGRTASKLRRERTKEKMKHAQAGEPFPLPDGAYHPPNGRKERS